MNRKLRETLDRKRNELFTGKMVRHRTHLVR